MSDRSLSASLSFGAAARVVELVNAEKGCLIARNARYTACSFFTFRVERALERYNWSRNFKSGQVGPGVTLITRSYLARERETLKKRSFPSEHENKIAM